MSFIITFWLQKNLNGYGIIWFGLRALVVVLLAIFATSFMLSFTKEFIFKNRLLPAKIRKYLNKAVIELAVLQLLYGSISLEEI